MEHQYNEDELAEIQRRLEKKELKRIRKEERRRREMEQNVIHIDTCPQAFASELNNQMMISITTSDQIPVSNLVNLSTNGMISITEKPPKKHKKIKKSKEKAVDIVIDTSMPASMVSVPQPFPFMVPMFDQSN
jgi:hypothetical protein